VERGLDCNVCTSSGHVALVCSCEQGNVLYCKGLVVYVFVSLEKLRCMMWFLSSFQQ
jgi:hypothetical protein